MNTEVGKVIGIFVVAAAALIVGFLLLRENAIAPETVPEDVSSTTTVQTARTFAWRFETTESADDLPPRTRVALITGGDVYDIGNFAGSCAEIAPGNLLEGEVSGVLCWWAGGGDEVGIFKDGEKYVVMHGTQEESSAESEGFRGGFTELLVIE